MNQTGVTYWFFFTPRIYFFRIGFQIARMIDMRSPNTGTEPTSSGNIIFYVSLSVLIGVIGFAMIILPQRG